LQCPYAIQARNVGFSKLVERTACLYRHSFAASASDDGDNDNDEGLVPYHCLLIVSV